MNSTPVLFCVGNIDRCPTYKGGKVTEVVVYTNYMGLRRFYRYMVDIGSGNLMKVVNLTGFAVLYKGDESLVLFPCTVYNSSVTDTTK